MKQIYANNAATTLSVAALSGDMTITVADGSKFPSPNATYNEFFVCTLENSGVIEVIEVTARSGNVFTIKTRGRENTTATGFPIGARVECRTTRDTLANLKSFTTLASLDVLPSPAGAYNNGYMCGTYDVNNNPIVCFKKDENTWRFLNYTLMNTGTVSSATTTSVTSTFPTLSLASNNYVIQFTSGALAGRARALTSASPTVVGWTTTLGSAPSAGDTWEIHRSNADMMNQLASVIAVKRATRAFFGLM